MKAPAKIKYKKIALALSLCALILWGILGTGASLAWFADTSPEINNIFHFADFKLEVSHQLADGTWEKVDSQTEIFDKEALYEPGYVQVVYLKVKNNGTVPFNFYTAVNVNGTGPTPAINAFGQPIVLQEHLRFGVIHADSEAELKNGVLDREKAIRAADMPLHNYSNLGVFELTADATKYIALIVRMPEEIGNVANYRGEIMPQIELGITVKADQIVK